MLRDDAISDTRVLEAALEERFSYLRVKSLDHRELFATLRDHLPEVVDPQRFGLELQKLMARFGDGHAAVNVRPPPGFTPFLVARAGDAAVAFQPDRAALLDPEHPFLTSIDGVSIDRWLRAASVYVPDGSPQFVKRNTMRWLRAIQMLRGDLGLPLADEVEVTVAKDGGGSPRTLRLPVAERAPQFDVWPRTSSGVLDGGIGYLRIPAMTSEAASEVAGWLERFAATEGLIVDVRGNGGGSREALLALLPLLMAPGVEPRVVNVAARRLWQGFPPDHLANRYLYPVSHAGWSPSERSMLERHMVDFVPEWAPPTDEFSAWHAMVVSPAADHAPRYLGRPVAVLMDSACFSATDVFLAALKGLPNVTLVGEASGGGSGRAQVVELPASGLKVRFASMVSFQASGELFEGRGVQPDVEVVPGSEFLVSGGADRVLEHGTVLVATGSVG